MLYIILTVAEVSAVYMLYIILTVAEVSAVYMLYIHTYCSRSQRRIYAIYILTVAEVSAVLIGDLVADRCSVMQQNLCPSFHTQKSLDSML